MDENDYLPYGRQTLRIARKIEQSLIDTKKIKSMGLREPRFRKSIGFEAHSLRNHLLKEEAPDAAAIKTRQRNNISMFAMFTQKSGVNTS